MSDNDSDNEYDIADIDDGADVIPDEYSDNDDVDIEKDEVDADAEKDELTSENNFDVVDAESEESPMGEFSSEIMVVPSDDRITSHWLSLYEATEIINIRTAQIAKYANCLADPAGLHDAKDQARRELQMRLVPLVLRRIVGERRHQDGKIYKYVELWDPNEMVIPQVFEQI